LTELLEPGAKLDRFTIVRRIGAGGMGVVYLAHDALLNVNVALKMLSPPYAKEKFFARLRREVLLARKVSHPGICRIFDLHEVDGQHAISMEYIEGQTLDSFIREAGILPLKLAGHLGLEICRAMTVAHRSKIIHRDLKPGNIILKKRNHISILDFGFARELDTESITGAGIRVGTVQYMSPEVLSGEQATRLSDIYSAGVILYHCVTGRLPFDQSNLLDMMEAIQSGNSIPPREFNSSIPPSLESIISQAIATDPKERYKSFVEFARALKQILDDLPAGKSAPLSSPWDGNIEKSVHELLNDSAASANLRSGVREATILFSDIVGITPYFDKHGDAAGHKKIQTHNEILFPVVRKHRGKIIKTIGDAIMACFDHADDGVEAAIEMQRAIDEHNSKIHDRKADERILIRIGLHSGRSVFEKRDVFGNTVNVAARIGSRASGGEILISSHTREMLDRNRKAAQFHGVTTLKGKRDVYNLYSIGWMNTPPASPAYNLPSTAMLPLTKRHAELGSESDAEVDTDADEDTGPLPPATDSVEKLVDLGSKADVQVESDTAPAGKKPSGWAETSTIDEEVAEPYPFEERPVSRAPEWNLVPIEAGEEDSTQSPDSGETPARPVFLSRLLVAVAVIASFALGVVLTRIFGASGESERSVPGMPGTVSPTGEAVDMLNSSIAEARRAAALALKTRRTETERRTSEKEIEEIKKKIFAAMRKRGIAFGDSQRLLAEYRRMKSLLERSEFTKAISAGEQALNAVMKIRINKAFVSEKLKRLIRYYDKAGDEAASGGKEDTTKIIVTAIEDGRYLQANQLLNRAFRGMESMRE